jgi:serine-type D-Ala-D-Ala carboxypeptidase (penicillin-binding protein 5/6)
MASLTKIMTIFTCLHAAEKFFISLDSLVKVPRIAAWTVGTSACLKEGDILTLKDLLYGLMLPSGNDAAQTIANFIGKQIVNSPNSPLKRRQALQQGV